MKEVCGNDDLRSSHQVPLEGQKTTRKQKFLALLLQKLFANLLVDLEIHLPLANNLAVAGLLLFRGNVSLHILHKHLELVGERFEHFILTHSKKMHQCTLCLVERGDA